jgi:hypothetical protein
MKHAGRIAAASIALLAVALLGVGLVRARDKMPPTPDDNTTALLVDKAREFAMLNGGSVPDIATVVLTDSNAVTDLFSPGSEAGIDQQVYAVEMEGEFVAEMAKLPDGEETPRGSALWFALESSTGEVTDWGVAAQPQDLSKLRDVSTLDLSSVSPS